MSTWMQVHTHGEGVIVAMDSQWALFVRRHEDGPLRPHDVVRPLRKGV